MDKFYYEVWLGPGPNPIPYVEELEELEPDIKWEIKLAGKVSGRKIWLHVEHKDRLHDTPRAAVEAYIASCDKRYEKARTKADQAEIIAADARHYLEHYKKED